MSYRKVRTVTRRLIAAEMGWSYEKTKSTLKRLQWLTSSYRVGRFQYNSDLIDALQILYGIQEPSTRESRDFLAHYLATQGDLDGRRTHNHRQPNEGPAQSSGGSTSAG